MCMLTFAYCKIPGCLKIDINSILDQYKCLDGEFIPHQDRNSTWIGPGPRCCGGVGSVLVWCKCLDEKICFTPYPWIGPGSEQMHLLNRVLLIYQSAGLIYNFMITLLISESCIIQLLIAD